MNIFVSKISFILVFTILILGSLWIGLKLFFVLVPFIIAYLLSKPLSRLTHSIHRYLHIPINVITFIVVVMFISGLIFSVSFGLYKGVTSLSGFSLHLVSVTDRIQNFTKTINVFEFTVPWLDHPISIGDLAIQFYDLIFKSIAGVTNSTLNIVLRIVKTIPSVGMFFFFLFVSLYFFTKDHQRVKIFNQNILDKVNTPFINTLKEKTFKTFGSYIKAQLILISITFIISLIALTILKIPFSPLIALGIALVDLIPMVGPAFVYFPWIITVFLIAEYSTGIGLLIAYLVTTLTRQIIEPKIVSSNIGTHPLFTIISMYVCYRFFGVIGFIVGPVLIMIILISINAYNDMHKKANIK